MRTLRTTVAFLVFVCAWLAACVVAARDEPEPERESRAAQEEQDDGHLRRAKRRLRRALRAAKKLGSRAQVSATPLAPVTLDASEGPRVALLEPQPVFEEAPATCRLDSDCAIGSQCENERCEERPPRPLVQKKTHEDHASVFFEVGVGIGVTSLTRSSRPDHLPEAQTIDRAVAGARDKSGRVDSAEVGRALQEEGWNCDEGAIASGEISSEDCAVALEPGLTSEPIFDLAIGYHLWSRLAVALTAMLQLHHGDGPMAGKLIGARVEYMVTAPVRRGPQLALLAGVGVGALHAQVRGAHHDYPRATNANPGTVGASMSLGARGAYRTSRNFAFNVTPLFNVGVPNFLLDMGLTGGVEVAF